MGIGIDKIHELADNLVGTCDNIDSVMRDLNIDFDDVSDEEWAAFDELVFACDNCGWWCDTFEKNVIEGEILCDDCKDIDSEYEDDV